MAKDKNGDQNQKVEETVQDDKVGKKEKKPMGFFKTMFIFLVALAVMIGVGFGTIIYLVKNNVRNVSNTNRATLEKVPVLKNFLPKPDSPDAEYHFSEKEIRSKYTELLEERNQLKKKLEEFDKKGGEDKKLKTENEKIQNENKSIKSEASDQKLSLQKEKEQLALDQKKFNQLVASGDKKAFKEFFEKVDKETAKVVYKEAVKDDTVDQKKKEIALIYQNMEPDASSKILQEIGANDKELVISILTNIKKDVSAEILAAMEPTFAARLSELMAQQNKKN